MQIRPIQTNINSQGLTAEGARVYVGVPNKNPRAKVNKVKVYNKKGGTEISNPFFVNTDGFYRNSTFTGERVFPWVDEDEVSVRWETSTGALIDHIPSLPSDAISTGIGEGIPDKVAQDFPAALITDFENADLIFVRSEAAGWEGTANGPDQGFFAYRTGANGAASTGTVDKFYDSAGVEYKSTNNMLKYDNTISGLTATNVKEAIDENAANIKKDLNWTSASTLGNFLSITGMGNFPIVAAMSGSRAAYYDNTLGELRAYDFDGEDWTLTGSGLSVSTSITAITALSSTDIAIYAAGGLSTYRFNGSTWSLVGAALAIVNPTGMAALNSTDIAFVYSEVLETYRFNGSTWSQVGSTFFMGVTSSPHITALNSTDIALSDNALVGIGELGTYRFNGSTWSLVGSTFAVPASFGLPSLAAMNGTDIGYFESGGHTLSIYRFNGSSWSKNGISSVTITSGVSSIASLNGSDVAFVEASSEKLQTYRFGFAIGSPYSREITG
jgi:hypothetical protein